MLNAAFAASPLASVGALPVEWIGHDLKWQTPNPVPNLSTPSLRLMFEPVWFAASGMFRRCFGLVMLTLCRRGSVAEIAVEQDANVASGTPGQQRVE